MGDNCKGDDLINGCIWFGGCSLVGGNYMWSRFEKGEGEGRKSGSRSDYQWGPLGV